MDNFVVPDWNAPLDVAEYVAGIPPSAVIKGVFPAAVAEAARKKNVVLKNARERYHPFTDVPLREYVPMLFETAVGMFPNLPPREGLRKLGRASRDAFERSMIGRILLTNFLDFRSSLALMGKAAAIATPNARIELREVTERRAVVSFSSVYTFVDCHHVGILEKLAAGSKLRVEARISLSTPYDGDIELTW
jgi:uncharacterized protein (TIGR02265 family)